MIGETLGHYVIAEKIGGGGMGIVYRARDIGLDRDVAIKVLPEHMERDETAWGRLLQEARMLSSLNHPHICAVYEVGEEDGKPYIAMEFVRGLPLSVMLRNGPLPSPQALQYGRQISQALAHAHEQGIIHGDLRSANVMITTDGIAKVLDFGLARRLQPEDLEKISTSHESLESFGPVGGTLPYLAPELLRGHSPNIQSDIWALGVLLYEVLTGKLPFAGRTPFELSTSIMTSSTRPPDNVPRALAKAVARCLEKKRARRYKNVPEVLQDLDAIQREQQSTSTRMPPAVFHKHPWLSVSIAALLLAAISLSIPPVRKVIFQQFSEEPIIVTPASQSAQSKPPAEEQGKATAVELANPLAKVWVNSASGIYHCPGTRWYGKTKQGEYMTQKVAKEKGYRPAHGKECL